MPWQVLKVGLELTEQGTLGSVTSKLVNPHLETRSEERVSDHTGAWTPGGPGGGRELRIEPSGNPGRHQLCHVRAVTCGR